MCDKTVSLFYQLEVWSFKYVGVKQVGMVALWEMQKPVDFGGTPAQETNSHLTGDYHPALSAHNQDPVTERQ